MKPDVKLAIILWAIFISLCYFGCRSCNKARKWQYSVNDHCDSMIGKHIIVDGMKWTIMSYNPLTTDLTLSNGMVVGYKTVDKIGIAKH